MKASPAPLRVAVVGAGRMGQNHLRVYDLQKSVTIAGVVDIDAGRARTAAERYGCAAFNSPAELIGKVDVASVCVPSVLHRDVGCLLLDNGIHCLIEKPLATSEGDCQALIEAAARSSATLMVGHVERFNPAVQQLVRLLDGKHQVHAIDARRLSWTSARITDVDVVLDLMVHDLDIVLSLVSEPVIAVAGSGVRTSARHGEDYVTALLSFSGGVTASLTASRITQTKVRELSLTTDIGYITVNYINQEILVVRRPETDRDPSYWFGNGDTILDSVVERVLVRNAEPLMLELQHFVDSVRHGTKPLVTGEHALKTLRIAHQIRDGIARLNKHG